MKQERAVRTRQALIRCAAEAFERHGYVQARLADISSSAGVTPGALHFHFETKAALASTVEASAAVILRRAAQDAQRPEMNARQRLVSTCQALAEQIRDDIVVSAGFYLSCEMPHRTGLDLRGEWFECIRQLLMAADDENLLTGAVGEQDAATSIAAVTAGLEVLGRAEPEWLSPDSLARFWRLVLPRLATSEAVATVAPEYIWPRTEARAEPRTGRQGGAAGQANGQR
jgi:AcrR family transcriptional regulator